MTLDLATFGRERSCFDVLLIDDPLVAVTLVIDSATGRVESIAQKPTPVTSGNGDDFLET